MALLFYSWYVRKWTEKYQCSLSMFDAAVRGRSLNSDILRRPHKVGKKTLISSKNVGQFFQICAAFSEYLYFKYVDQILPITWKLDLRKIF